MIDVTAGFPANAKLPIVVPPVIIIVWRAVQSAKKKLQPKPSTPIVPVTAGIVTDVNCDPTAVPTPLNT